MAKYILIDAMRGFRAGTIFDTAQGKSPAGLIAAGAAMVLLPSPVVEAAAVSARKAYARGAGDDVATRIMKSSLDIPAIPGEVSKLCVSGVATALMTVDMDLTGDNTWGGRLFFCAEHTDGTDFQLREGDVNVALVSKAGAFTTAQTSLLPAGALSAGTLTATWSWTTSGRIATLFVTLTSSLGGSPKINAMMLFASHQAHSWVPLAA